MEIKESINIKQQGATVRIENAQTGERAEITLADLNSYFALKVALEAAARTAFYQHD